PRDVLEAVTFYDWRRAAFSTVLRCRPSLEATSRRLSKLSASASASSCFTQSETPPESGAPSRADCGASSKPGVGGVDFFDDLAMGGIWRESTRKGRGTGTKGKRTASRLAVRGGLSQRRLDGGAGFAMRFSSSLSYRIFSHAPRSLR